MEDDMNDVDAREAVFHNVVRECIVSKCCTLIVYVQLSHLSESLLYNRYFLTDDSCD